MRNRPGYSWIRPWGALGVFTAILAFGVVAARGQFAEPMPTDAEYAAQRIEMVERNVADAGIVNERVLDAMRATPRHEFMPAEFRKSAYFDAAFPIGALQTISPPYVVAYMTEALDPQPTDRVLEIGTGSGYQAAVLSPLVKDVYTIEIVKELGERATRTLKRLKYANVHVRVGDGYKGWPERAPFDKIIVTCSPENVPQPLVDQLREGGQMIIPVGERFQQNLYRMTKSAGKLTREPLQATLFVPMTGQAESSRKVQPDPLRPECRNGGFEEPLGATGLPAGWYYLREASLTNNPDAPQGTHYLSVENMQPGRAGQALQGFAVDGRRVGRLTVSCMARGKELADGPNPDAAAAIIVTFYNARRAAIGSDRLGPWSGSFPWRREEGTLRVPLAAVSGIVRVGLHGGLGRLDVDEVRIAPTASGTAKAGD